MRLYLTADGFGSEPQRLVELFGGGARVAVICNSIDDRVVIERQQAVDREVAHLRKLGFDAAEVDLRRHFAPIADSVRTALDRFDAVWLRGGNSFVLRRALRQSAADIVLTELLDVDGIAWGGASAGAIVAGASLRGIERMNDADEVPSGYDPEPVWTGLGLVPYAIVPHFETKDVEAQAAASIVETWTAAQVPFRALGDGETIIIDGSAVTNTPRRSTTD